MNKIVSNFYLIRLNGEPVYVGYTNRTIKQRFSEHKRDKNFGDGVVDLESLGKLEYDFTWDMGLINKYASEVSNREAELIKDYGTQDSVWQKGINENIGGQTWADVKYFIKTNRDNPKFIGLSEDSILVYLESSNKIYGYMRNFIGDMGNPISIYMKNFVSHMNDPVTMYMRDFVAHMDDVVTSYIKSFVSNMNEPIDIYMKNFVHNMDDSITIYMKNFVGGMNDPVTIYMRDFIKTMNNPVVIYMSGFVNHMDDSVAIYIQHFVSHMSEPIDN